MNYVYVLTSVLSFYANYLGLSFSLLHHYYHTKVASKEQWKIQPERDGVPYMKRPKLHLVYWFINTLLGAVNSVITYHFTVMNQNAEKDIYAQLTTVLYLHTVHTIFSYFWHRTMHIPFIYKRLHKVHHFYKSPMPLDDLFFHPLEYGIYGMCLMIPLFTMELTSMEIILYLTPIGITGLLDHCGIKFDAILYNTEHHDAHHELFNVNFGFPVPFMDILFGTFKGEFFGKLYDGKLKAN